MRNATTLLLYVVLPAVSGVVWTLVLALAFGWLPG